MELESFEVNCSPLSEMRATVHPHRDMYWSMRMSAVSAALNWAAATAYISARRLEWSMKRRIWELPRRVRGSGPK